MSIDEESKFGKSELVSFIAALPIAVPISSRTIATTTAHFHDLPDTGVRSNFTGENLSRSGLVTPPSTISAEEIRRSAVTSMRINLL